MLIVAVSLRKSPRNVAKSEITMWRIDWRNCLSLPQSFPGPAGFWTEQLYPRSFSFFLNISCIFLAQTRANSLVNIHLSRPRFGRESIDFTWISSNNPVTLSLSNPFRSPKKSLLPSFYPSFFGNHIELDQGQVLLTR